MRPTLSALVVLVALACSEGPTGVPSPDLRLTIELPDRRPADRMIAIDVIPVLGGQPLPTVTALFVPGARSVTISVPRPIALRNSGMSIHAFDRRAFGVSMCGNHEISPSVRAVTLRLNACAS